MDAPFFGQGRSQWCDRCISPTLSISFFEYYFLNLFEFEWRFLLSAT
jgi:hypothetical protein